MLDLSILYTPGGTEPHFAPWRVDPRPTSGLIQGVYAFLGIADSWHRLRRSPALRDQATAEFAENRTLVAAGLTTLEHSTELTPTRGGSSPPGCGNPWSGSSPKGCPGTWSARRHVAGGAVGAMAGGSGRGVEPPIGRTRSPGAGTWRRVIVRAVMVADIDVWCVQGPVTWPRSRRAPVALGDGCVALRIAAQPWACDP